MTNPLGNLFANITTNLPEELFETLVSSPGVRIERIVSQGHTSPQDYWYDQDTDEWVVLLKGAARLQFENSETPLEMNPGSHILIPAHTRHRVAWTDPTQPAIWLAVHFQHAID
jgi:cupin 2 domain-containing protein